MKKILWLLVLAVAMQAHAQSTVTEGRISFAVTYPDLPEEMKQAAGMLPNKLTIYFKGERSRSEAISQMGTTINMRNTRTNESVMLFDAMGQKTAVKQTAEDMKKMEAAAGLKTKATLLDGTKTIAGYTCKKALLEITNADGTEFKMECFYTNALSHESDPMSYLYKDIKGFMMEYTVALGEIKMQYTATAVSPEKVDDSMFIIPSDYKILTQEEMEKMMGGSK